LVFCRAGNTVRITVQLINAVNGFHMWSQNNDRNLSDILKVQSDVAISVAQQLEVKLAGDEANKVGLGGTKNPEAYDSFLRGEQFLSRQDKEADKPAELAAFDRAIALDPDYAAPYASRSLVLLNIATATTNPGTREQLQQQALAAAQHAVALAPEFGAAHLALGAALLRSLEFVKATPEFERALALAPGSSRVQHIYALYAVALGYFDPSVVAARRAVSLDPQNWWAHYTLAWVYVMAHRFGEAQTALQSAQALNPASHQCLAKAERLSDPSLGWLKETGDSIRSATIRSSRRSLRGGCFRPNVFKSRTRN